MDRSLVLAFSKINGIGIRKIIEIHSNFPDLKTEDLSDIEVISRLSKIVGPRPIEQIKNINIFQAVVNRATRHLHHHQDESVEIVTFFDENYPPLLKNIPDPPIALYCRGNMEALVINKNIAVVGTRDSSPKGNSVALKLSFLMAQRGWSIISGLAVGIDTAAHKGAINAGGITVAVLPGPQDNIAPKYNQQLATDIISNKGLLISEYPNGHIISKHNYVRRDRIQSGLSLAVLVIQTAIKGGTMETVSFAQKYGRLIACPQPFESMEYDRNRGVKKLIDEGIAVEVIDTEIDKLEAMIETRYADFLTPKKDKNLGTTQNLVQGDFGFE